MGMLGEALLGAIVPAGSIWLGGWLFEKLRHKEGLGFGDVKMLAMVGAFLGIRGALLTIMLGAVAGSVVGLVFIKMTGRMRRVIRFRSDRSWERRRWWRRWRGRA